jgi:hypothetical protein
LGHPLLKWPGIQPASWGGAGVLSLNVVGWKEWVTRGVSITNEKASHPGLMVTAAVWSLSLSPTFNIPWTWQQEGRTGTEEASLLVLDSQIRFIMTATDGPWVPWLSLQQRKPLPMEVRLA